MMRKRLIIDGQECDLKQGVFPFSISYKVDDSGFIAASSSKRSVRLPSTANNDAIFGDWGQVSNNNGDAAEFREFSYSQGGVTLFKGQAELQSSPLQSDRYRFRAKEYKVDLYGNNADWALLLQDTKLSDLEYQDQIYNQSTIVNGWYADYPTEEAGFTVVKWKEWEKPGKVKLEELTPFVFIRTILDKAFQSIGYRIISNFLDSEAFTRLIHLAPLPDRYPQEFSEDYLNIIASTAAGTTPFNGTVDFLTQTKTPALLDPYDEATGIYTVPFTGFYEITVFGQSSNFNDGGTGNGYSFLGQSQINGIPNSIPSSLFGAATLGVNAPYDDNETWNNTSDVVFLQAGDEISLVLVTAGQAGVTYDYTLSWSVIGEAELTFGCPLIYKYLLGNGKVLDMIKDLQLMFNLRFEADPLSRQVVIEPADQYLYQANTNVNDDPPTEPLELRAGFYRPTGQDNTEDFDLSREAELYNETDIPRITQLQYISEGDTEEFLELNQALGIHTAQYILPDNRFNEETDIKELEYFAKTICELDRDITADDSQKTVQVPLIYPQNYIEDPTASEANYEVSPRILYFGGFRPFRDAEIRWDAFGDFGYPLSFMVNYQDETDFSLSFATESINGVDVPGLLRAFHLQDFARKRIGKRLEAFYFWDILKISALTFRDLKTYDSREYVLSEVDGYRPLLETPTKTVLKLDQKPEQEDEDAINNTLLNGKATLVE
jgi:hypothetical protein